MSRPNSKDIILDAAEAIVCESGAAHMTLDAVAERAKVSKGGLIYNFPTKEALLQAMIGRLIDGFEDQRERVRRELSLENPSELAIEIKMLSTLDETKSRRNAALLAVIANQPELMETFRERARKHFSDRIVSKEHPGLSTILYFAALGVHLTALLNIPIVDAKRRKEIYADLLGLANGDKDIRIFMDRP